MSKALEQFMFKWQAVCTKYYIFFEKGIFCVYPYTLNSYKLHCAIDLPVMVIMWFFILVLFFPFSASMYYIAWIETIPKFGGTWVAQSVKHPTLAQVMLSRSVSSSPTSGSVLTAQSPEPASDSVSPSLCPSPTRTLSLSLTLSKQINIF